MSIPFIFAMFSMLTGGAGIPIKNERNGMLHYHVSGRLWFLMIALVPSMSLRMLGPSTFYVGSSAITDLAGRCLLHYCRRQGWRLSTLRLLTHVQVLVDS